MRPINFCLVRYSQYRGPKYCHTSNDFALADADEVGTNKPQIVSISPALNRLNDSEMKAFFTVCRRSFNSILSNARPTSISPYRRPITTKKIIILGTGRCILTLAGVNSVVYDTVVYGNVKRDVTVCIQVSKFLKFITRLVV